SIVTIVLHDKFVTTRHANLATNAILKPVKVFQIGFSKCGTSTLADFFNRNGVPAVHHDFGHLATSIFRNAKEGLPLLAPQYAQYSAFTDMERMYEDPPLNVGMSLFKELDKQYPGSKFILNTRNKQAWFQSRAKHRVGNQNGPTLLEINIKIFKLSADEVLAKWSREWDDHHQRVQEYFKDRPEDLLIFDIDHDSPEKLTAFLRNYFVLNPKLYKHSNKTAKKSVADETVAQVEIFSKTYMKLRD
ncbi:MAG TPA: sulfotransferase, partial [Gammaproteobacteria bacterium]|nr:sulfotransferase [Gammaproteobacteria bacterium]